MKSRKNLNLSKIMLKLKKLSMYILITSIMKKSKLFKIILKQKH